MKEKPWSPASSKYKLNKEKIIIFDWSKKEYFQERPCFKAMKNKQIAVLLIICQNS